MYRLNTRQFLLMKKQQNLLSQAIFAATPLQGVYWFLVGIYRINQCYFQHLIKSVLRKN